MRLEDLDLHEVGVGIQLAGAVWADGDDRLLFLPLPGEATDAGEQSYHGAAVFGTLAGTGQHLPQLPRRRGHLRLVQPTHHLQGHVSHGRIVVGQGVDKGRHGRVVGRVDSIQQQKRRAAAHFRLPALHRRQHLLPGNRFQPGGRLLPVRRVVAH